MNLANAFYRFSVLWGLHMIVLNNMNTEDVSSWVFFFIPAVLALVSGLSNIGDK